MFKMFDFATSRIFATHVTGLLSIVVAGHTMPNTPLVALAIAVLTGITQAAHAYQNVKTLQKTGEAAPGGFVVHPVESAHAAGANATHDEAGPAGATPNTSASPVAPAPHH